MERNTAMSLRFSITTMISVETMLKAAIITISSSTRKYTVFSSRRAAKRLGHRRVQSSTRYLSPTAC